MARETAPPGTTFKERWPLDASERDYLAAPFVPIVLGGLAGLFAVPALLAQAFLAATVPVTIVVALGVILTTLAIAHATAKPARWIVRIWKLATWIAAAIALGLVVTAVGAALCDGSACATASRYAIDRAIPMAVTFALSLGGAFAITFAVERGARALVAWSRARAS
ncbi:MAG TPA: hypothetical protein VF119_05800 [Candidatus Limnocylindrales bacterium]